MRVNEIFYSLQGEGYYTGTPAVFVRLSGCNLRCWFCDTQHADGQEMTEAEVVAAVAAYPTRHVVITGGEPTLQLTASLVAALHAEGFFVQIETNGTRALPQGCDVDWVTCSPKGAPLALARIDELKVVYEGSDAAIDALAGVVAREYRLQPCDTGDEARNREILSQTIHYILEHPQWKLSLQTHKILNVR